MPKDIVILSIDDDKQISFALGELLKLQGWRAYCANSVEKGVELFEKHRPDIVLIDYHMPHVNGVDGVKILRKKDATVPIIVFTIDESQAVADAFLEAGASDFALKPIKAPDLVSRIKLHLRLLEHRGQNMLEKGLSQNTLDLIVDYLGTVKDYTTANEIAEGTGLAYQTVYRYLQHLVRIRRVEQFNTYGKVGRPKQLFRKIR